MFSFLSPVSTRSAWINFEAGYAYARGVKVVPVAILSQDLNALHPPLSLLQGFNIRSYEGMNNILSVINATFQTTYPLSFSKDDYSSVFASTDESKAEFFGEQARHVIRLSIDAVGSEAVFETLRSSLEHQHHNAYRDEYRSAASGIEIKKYQSEQGPAIEISIAPELFRHNISLLRDCFSKLPVEDKKILIHLAQHCGIGISMWELTAKFHGTAIKPAGARFLFEGVSFAFVTKGYVGRPWEDDTRPLWAIEMDASVLERPELIPALLDLLHKSKAIETPDYDVPF